MSVLGKQEYFNNNPRQLTVIYSKIRLEHKKGELLCLFIKWEMKRKMDCKNTK